MRKPSKLADVSSTGPQEVTRHIKPETTAMLWGRAAGRCEFWGCNESLWKSRVTQEPVNRAQRAHIYSFNSGGPRGNDGIAAEQLNDFDNLILVCHGCHQKIDKYKDGGRYTVEILRQWKAAHERRVEIVTGIDASKRSHIVLYGANVGDHSSPLNFNEAAQALFPQMHASDDRPILLGTINSSFTDRSTEFWAVESKNLRTQFARRVRERIAAGEIEHISIFAIAPQPLLILLGTLMMDIVSAEVFQRHREPQTWSWPECAEVVTFDITEPKKFDGPPVLVLALSAPVAIERITDVVGHNACIWHVTVSQPHNDLIKSRAHLANFRATIRPLLDRIKLCHGQTTPLHIFPAAGVAANVELGRIRMPKAHMPWELYDQVNHRGGFIHALTISRGDER